MTPDQFDRLIKSLEGLKDVDPHYTLAGAQDWGMLVVLGGTLGAIVCALLIYIWQDLKSTVKDHRGELHQEIEAEKTERKEQINILWAAVHACQEDCCPRRKTG